MGYLDREAARGAVYQEKNIYRFFDNPARRPQAAGTPETAAITETQVAATPTSAECASRRPPQLPNRAHEVTFPFPREGDAGRGRIGVTRILKGRGRGGFQPWTTVVSGRKLVAKAASG